MKSKIKILLLIAIILSVFLVIESNQTENESVKNLEIKDSEYLDDSYLKVEDKKKELVGNSSSVTNSEGIDLVIPEGTTEIKEGEYEGRTDIKSVIIPSSVVSIGKDAFFGCENLTDITISEGVTSIGGAAFEGCISLTSITIPSSVISIGEWAFDYCINLTAITLSNGLKDIGYGAFFDCKSLTSITIPSTVISIGYDLTFDYCTSLINIEVSEENDNYKSIDGNLYSKDGKILIKYAIGKDAKVFTIPEGVTSISSKAFYHCTNLTTVEIPNSVTSIGSWAFSGCTNLTSIVLPNSLKSIDSEVFSDCNKLEKIIIRKGAQIRKNKAFYNLTNTKIFVEAKEEDVNWASQYPNWNNGNKVYYGGEWIEVKFYDQNGKLIFTDYFSTTDTITTPTPSDYTEGCYTYTFIGWDINDDGIVDTLPETSSDNITAKAVYSKSLTNVTHHDKVNSTCTNKGSIEYWTCETCGKNYSDKECTTEVTDITINELGHNYELQKETVDGKVYDIYVCDCCGVKTSIIIPEGTIEIKNDEFSCREDIVYILIPKSVTSIGDYAFSSCENLVNIIIPDSVINIGCGSFFGCTNLTTAEISRSVTSIGETAFSSCTSLTSIEVAKENEKYGSIDGNLYSKDGKTLIQYAVGKIDSSFTMLNNVTSVSTAAFYDCKHLENVYYTGNIIDWCNINFNNFSSNPMYCGKHFYILDDNNKYKEVTEIIIPNTITEIGENQFCGFDNVTSVTIPNGVRSIGEAAFSSCTNLKNITISNSVTSIGDNAFSNCTNLITVEISNSVTSIGELAFSNCTNLASITITKNLKNIGKSAFNNCTNLKKVYYDGTIENWCNIEFSSAYSNPMYYANYFYMLDTNNVYKEVTEIVIPDTITKINYCQFYGFSTLVKIVIPNSVTNIGYCAFSNCSNLTDIIIPNSVTSIDGRAFSNCTSLTSIIIPSSVTSFGYNMFMNCINLKKVLIKNSKMSISNSSFSGLTNAKIFIEAKEEDVDWASQYPDWYYESKGNSVYYCGEWIEVKFYDQNDKLISTDRFSTTDTITTPTPSDYTEGCYTYTFIGWDINDDGIVDTLPETSSDNITAKAVYSKSLTNVTHHDRLDATCTSKGNIEYWTCETCGKNYSDESGTTEVTDITINALGHNYSTTWSSDKDHHFHECSRCHERSEEASHIPGPDATYTKPQTCTVCNYIIKNKLPLPPHSHNYEKTWSYDSTRHYHKCRGCSSKQSAEDHIYDNDCDTTCNTCGYTRSITHKYKEEWLTDENTHYHECSVCHIKADISDHSYLGACGTTCTVCGYIREVTHDYELKYDKYKHYHECKLCGAIDGKEEHIEVPISERIEATCEKEGLTEGKKCSVCDYIIQAQRVIKKTAHDFIKKQDETKHYNECRKCHLVENEEEHIYDKGVVIKEATCEETGSIKHTCVKCNYEKIEDLEKLGHKYKEEWVKGTNTHYHECERCHERNDEESHTWDNGVVTKEATTKEEGKKTYTCSICGETKEEIIPVILKPHKGCKGLTQSIYYIMGIFGLVFIIRKKKLL